MAARQVPIVLSMLLAGCTTGSLVGTGPDAAERPADAGDVVDASRGTDAGASDARVPDPDGGSTGLDAGQAEEDPDAGGPPPGHVPVFVAVAHGAWTATTCNGGDDWITQEQSSTRSDHSEWAAFGGIASLAGAFVVGTGWGAPGHVLHSDDGVDWTDLPDDRFTRDGTAAGFDDSIGGVISTGTELLIYSRYVWRSTDGQSWEGRGRTFPPGVHQVRQIRGFPATGHIVASVETQYGDEHPHGNFVLVSDDGGETWREGTGYANDCSHAIQHWGDIEMHDGVLLVGANELCRSTDAGESWEALGNPIGGAVQDLFTDGTHFYALAGRGVYRSTDGAEWESVADLGAIMGRGAFGGGHYVVVSQDGSRSFRSDDGETWVEAASPGGSSTLRDLGFGWALPSDRCPD